MEMEKGDTLLIVEGTQNHKAIYAPSTKLPKTWKRTSSKLARDLLAVNYSPPLTKTSRPPQTISPTTSDLRPCSSPVKNRRRHGSGSGATSGPLRWKRRLDLSVWQPDTLIDGVGWRRFLAWLGRSPDRWSQTTGIPSTLSLRNEDALVDNSR
ncbi:ribosomal RNA small subunit methyltransferase H [Striga asiatica]|uniref:Ribosomal RNA small subunit methyltransferase H n=1 Tax=Striga asiatica TaxID=4170 RepID=A0A5A7PWS9_STRAF|nr:ribosomal RNA small subunit methyltransferase H [Striga asiatica]